VSKELGCLVTDDEEMYTPAKASEKILATICTFDQSLDICRAHFPNQTMHPLKYQTQDAA